jgi:hypothetical protein
MGPCLFVIEIIKWAVRAGRSELRELTESDGEHEEGAGDEEGEFDGHVKTPGVLFIIVMGILLLYRGSWYSQIRSSSRGQGGIGGTGV